jgi:diguanylate cyclase (GGDEF)-like protein
MIDKQVLLSIAGATAAAVAMSAAITVLGSTVVFGADPHTMISARHALIFGLVVSTLAPMLICPIVHYRIIATVQERDRAHAALHRIAQTDQLTGLLNRRGFEIAAEAAATRVSRGQLPASALMLDIDFFKMVNDSYGHDFGDAALVHVAAILRQAADKHGFIVGRQGGEEFVAFLPGKSGAEAAAIAEDLRKACLSVAVSHGDNSATITMSIGAAARTPAPCSLADLLSRADAALYRAKQEGRNRVVLERPATVLVNVA